MASKPDPDSIMQRVRRIFPTLEGEFTCEAILDAMNAPLKRRNIHTAIGHWANVGVIKKVGRETKPPRRVIYVYAKPK